MKYITPFIILVCSLFAKSINAQTVVTIPATAPATCDGIAYIDSSQSFTSWYWTDNSGNTIQNGLDTLNSLCVGTYILNYTNFMGPGADTFDIIENPCSNLQLSLAGLAPNTNPINCNGIIFGQVSGGSAPYYYLWNNGVNTDSLFYACGGSYSLTVTDANGCVVTSSFTVLDSITPLVITADLEIFDETASGLCNGSASVVNVTGGIPPYSYLHSDGTQLAEATYLCAGIYDVTIIDSSGNSLTLTYIIADPGNVIFNLPYPDSVIVDSLFNNTTIENCDIDYNSVNAAYIYNASLAGFDSVVVTWAIYDSSGVNYLTETYYFGGGNGVYSLALNVYCPQKSIDQYLKVYDQLYLSEELGITESTLNNLIIFPNPFSEYVSIQFEKTGDYEIELLDLTGRSISSHKVTAQNTFILNSLNMLANGEYLLRINSDYESVIRKIVK